jgi:hypothetical protein
VQLLYNPALELDATFNVIAFSLEARGSKKPWVSKMTFAVLMSTSPTRDAWCTGRRVS